MCISSFAIKLGTGLKRHTEKHVCASPKRILFESAVGRTNNVTQERTARCKQDGIGGRLSQIRAQSGPDIIPYEVIKPKSGNTSYELRFYQPRFIVEMPYKSRSTAYIAFDKYLTGENESSIHLETLSPVVMRHDPEQGSKLMQMFVKDLGTPKQGPLNLTQQPPLPKDDQLTLDIAGGEVVAALTFSGQATRDSTYQAAERLRTLLKQDGIGLAVTEEAGGFRLAQFDPVHSLKERTNELWLAVSI